MWFRHRDHCDLILSLTAGQIGHCDRHQNPATDKNTHLNSWWFCFIIFVMWNGEVCFRGSVGLVCVFQWWQAESGPVCPGRWRLTCVKWQRKCDGRVHSCFLPAALMECHLESSTKAQMLSGRTIVWKGIDHRFLYSSRLYETLCPLWVAPFVSPVPLWPRWCSRYLCFFFVFVFLLREHHYNYCWYLRLVMWTNIIM